MIINIAISPVDNLVYTYKLSNYLDCAFDIIAICHVNMSITVLIVVSDNDLTAKCVN